MMWWKWSTSFHLNEHHRTASVINTLPQVAGAPMYTSMSASTPFRVVGCSFVSPQQTVRAKAAFSGLVIMPSGRRLGKSSHDA